MNVGPVKKADALSIDPAAKQSRKVQVVAKPDQHSKKGDSPKGALGVFHLAQFLICTTFVSFPERGIEPVLQFVPTTTSNGILVNTMNGITFMKVHTVSHWRSTLT